MYKYEISDRLLRILKKLSKKDNIRYEAILKKIDEITKSDSEHYKNLRYNMKNYKRVHIDSSFVLVFVVDKNKNIIYFEDFAHHDDIYKR